MCNVSFPIILLVVQVILPDTSNPTIPLRADISEHLAATMKLLGTVMFPSIMHYYHINKTQVRNYTVFWSTTVRHASVHLAILFRFNIPIFPFSSLALSHSFWNFVSPLWLFTGNLFSQVPCPCYFSHVIATTNLSLKGQWKLWNSQVGHTEDRCPYTCPGHCNRADKFRDSFSDPWSGNVLTLNVTWCKKYKTSHGRCEKTVANNRSTETH
jgi:hypothetical protein